MTPEQFREKLFFVVKEAITDKDMQPADILGSIHVIYVNFRLAYEMKAEQITRKVDMEDNAS